MSEEWAIQDSATGEWFTTNGWDEDKPHIYKTYSDATNGSPFRSHVYFRETARIVPALPREMTDAECWEWLQEHNHLAITWGRWSEKLLAGWFLQDVHGDGEQYDTAVTPCDAIRAARRKLEGK